MTKNQTETLENSIAWQRRVIADSRDPKQVARCNAAIGRLQEQIAFTKAAGQDMTTRQASWLVGAERDLAELTQRKASEPLKPKVAQLPADHGLFSDESSQLDLVEMFQD
jgi:hypothetical protein